MYTNHHFYYQQLITMWNNVRYSWNFKTKTHFAKDSPIWLLGRIYHASFKSDDSSSLPSNNFDALKSDFLSRIWYVILFLKLKLKSNLFHFK